MNRDYTTRFYRDVVEKLQSVIPDVCIGTDIIAGFPGESEHEFETTFQFLESLPLAYFHVFPFSPRQQTPAATMSGQVKGSVIKERAKILRNLSDLKRETYYKSFEGRELQVLVQSREANGSFKGLSRNYITVSISGTGCSINSEVEVRVRKVSKNSVRGDLTS
jgi:threonylcarbamoyladenosine tRNA methylthiotransferase MtaB